MTGIALWLAVLASAQTRGTVPEVDVDLWTPRVEAGDTLWTEDSLVPPDRTPYLALAGTWAQGPLSYRYGDGSEVDLVQGALRAHVLGGIALGRFRLGADLPVYAHVAGEGFGPVRALGDAALDAKGTILDRRIAPVGLGVATRLTLPTATAPGPLGDPGVRWELSGIVDRPVGPVLVAVQAGVRVRPRTELEGVVVDDQAFARLGASLPLSSRAGLSADLGLDAGLWPSDKPVLAMPVQGLVGGWAHLTEQVVLRGGLGAGLTPGVGAPAARGLLGIAWQPEVIADVDADGIADADDACPRNQEDLDEYEDDDGCPEPGALVQVAFVGPDGDPVPGAAVTVGEGEDAREGSNPFEAVLLPGSVPVQAAAEGWREASAQIAVSSSERGYFTIEMEPLPETGSVRLIVLDPDARPVDNAYVSLDSATREPVPEDGTIPLSPDQHLLLVGAPGHGTAFVDLEVQAGEQHDVRVTLAKARATLAGDRIELHEKVFFDTDAARIRPESHDLLDDVAGVLLDHPAARRVRIEGHTDARGSVSYNDDLSQRRADAVRDYLVARGVAVKRLESVGLGERHPVVEGDGPEALERNRRVEMFVVEWAEDGR